MNVRYCYGIERLPLAIGGLDRYSYFPIHTESTFRVTLNKTVNRPLLTITRIPKNQCYRLYSRNESSSRHSWREISSA